MKITVKIPNNSSKVGKQFVIDTPANGQDCKVTAKNGKLDLKHIKITQGCMSALISNLSQPELRITTLRIAGETYDSVSLLFSNLEKYCDKRAGSQYLFQQRY